MDIETKEVLKTALLGLASMTLEGVITKEEVHSRLKCILFTRPKEREYAINEYNTALITLCH